ncbi:hypothetical protein MtrunA17_Chr7g0258121 [Medicago truncatula]|uniref:Uncharacterized protein n=1 Tax=Medicago truncatula TaxID=3880 RepID=A0A396H582_MEDTR|nr:hypothetical protein MtrunA17_Chr7g0258121 [Medicago truncatula]
MNVIHSRWFELHRIIPLLKIIFFPSHFYISNLKTFNVLHHYPCSLMFNQFLASWPIVKEPTSITGEPSVSDIHVDEAQVS